MFAVSYEELVLEPESIKNKVLDFLKLDEPIVDASKVRVDKMFESTHQLVSKQFNPSRINAWRNQLTAKQVQIFEGLAGGLLRPLGYELSCEKVRGPNLMMRHLDPILDAINQLIWQLPKRLIRHHILSRIRDS